MPRRRHAASFLPGLFMAGVEAQQVIALRMMKLALGGPDVGREATRMVDEKIQTAMQVQAQAAAAVMAGGGAGAPAAALATYRRKMRANRRRLIRGG